MRSGLKIIQLRSFVNEGKEKLVRRQKSVVVVVLVRVYNECKKKRRVSKVGLPPICKDTIGVKIGGDERGLRGMVTVNK